MDLEILYPWIFSFNVLYRLLVWLVIHNSQGNGTRFLACKDKKETKDWTFIQEIGKENRKSNLDLANQNVQVNLETNQPPKPFPFSFQSIPNRVSSSIRLSSVSHTSYFKNQDLNNNKTNSSINCSDFTYKPFHSHCLDSSSSSWLKNEESEE